MDDRELIQRISRLVEEEHTLLGKGDDEDSGLSLEDRARLQDIGTALDQCWDLHRQRRARREFGMDPDRARVRDAATIRHYLQ